MAEPQPCLNGVVTDVLPLSDLMADVSGELAGLAERCSLLQWTISSLLDRLDHPDLGAEIHMLQDVDRIQQTLADLASVLAAARADAGHITCRQDALCRVIRLESLRTRLGLSGEKPDKAHEPDETDVTWL